MNKIYKVLKTGQAVGENAKGNTGTLKKLSVLAVALSSAMVGTHAMAVDGANVAGAGEKSVMLGHEVVADGNNSTVVGSNNQGLATNNVVVGTGLTAKEENGIAVGSGTTVNGANSISVGNNNTMNAKATGEILLGNNLISNGALTHVDGVEKDVATNILVGTANTVNGGKNIVVGSDTTLNHGREHISIGNNNTVGGKDNSNSINIGSGNTNTSSHTTTIGDNLDIKSGYAVVIGKDINDKQDGGGTSSVALGHSLTIGATNTVNIGVNNVTASAYDVVVGNDIINKKHITNSFSANVAIGKDIKSDVLKSVAIGTKIENSSEQGVTLGYNANNNNKESVVIGSEINSFGLNSVTVGSKGAVAKGSQSIALGMGAVAGTAIDKIEYEDAGPDRGLVEKVVFTPATSDNIAIGTKANAENNTTIAIGKEARTFADNAVSLGNNSSVGQNGINGVVVGNNSNVNAKNTAVLGNNAIGRQANSVVLGNESVDKASTSIQNFTFATVNPNVTTGDFAGFNPVGVASIGDKGKERQIVNVGAGELSATSTDAVNGSQLYQVVDKLTGMRTRIDKGNNIEVEEVVNLDGAKTYKVGTKNNVNFNSVTTNNATLGDTVQITQNVKDGNGNNKISGVGGGNIAIGSTEAVNGDQVAKLAKSVADNLGGGSSVNTDGTVRNPTYNVAGGEYNNVGEALTALDNKTDPLAIRYDTQAKDKLTLQGQDGTSIKNVKAGEISATSKDGVNGSQLYNVAKGLKDVLGGGATVGADGKVIANNIGNTGKNTIDEAINEVGKRRTTVTAGKNIKVTESTNANGGKNYQVGVLDDININTANIGTVAIAEKDNNGNTKITGVGDGIVAENSTDAINGKQLWALDTLNVKYDNKEKDAITLGTTKGGTKVKNMEAGEVSRSSREAINGSQLHKSIIENSVVFGGGSMVDKNGNLIKPKYTVDKKTFDNVGDAIQALDKKKPDISEANRYTDKKVGNLEKKLSAGIASVTALEPAPIVAGKWTYSVGAGHYNGQSAIGATLRKTADNGRWSITGGVASGISGKSEPVVRLAVSGVLD